MLRQHRGRLQAPQERGRDHHLIRSDPRDAGREPFGGSRLEPGLLKSPGGSSRKLLATQEPQAH